MTLENADVPLVGDTMLGANSSHLSFASFWAGAISGYEIACISSFLARGHEFFIYSYSPIEGLPSGVTSLDAREITEQDNVSRFLINGKGNLSHFSDLFRYRLFEKTGHAWVDLDMMAVRPINLNPNDNLLAKEDEGSICGAIMRLRQDTPNLDMLIYKTEEMRDRNLVWGATGPGLLTSIFAGQQVLETVHPTKMFFPIHFNDSWKMLLPERREECDELCQGAYTVHLWNDRLVKTGVWKKFCPPKGSFLEQHFKAHGCLDRFDDVYPESVMRNMVDNWRIRCEGGDIGLGQWMRLALPSAKLTYRRRFKLPT